MCVCCRSPLQQAHKRKLKGTVAQGCGCCSRCQGGSDSMLYVVQKCIFTISTRHSNFFKHYYYIVPALRNFHQNCRTLRFRRSSQFLYSDGLVNVSIDTLVHSEAFLALGSYSIIHCCSHRKKSAILPSLMSDRSTMSTSSWLTCQKVPLMLAGGN